MPDIDIPRSAIGRLLRPLSTEIERRWGHRNPTHGLLALAVLAVALADYEQITGETVLEFRGRWRDSREEVEGEGVILATGRPVRWDNLEIRGLTWNELLSLLTTAQVSTDAVERPEPSGHRSLENRIGWVWGVLRADRPFVPRGTSQDEMAAVAQHPPPDQAAAEGDRPSAAGSLEALPLPGMASEPGAGPTPALRLLATRVELNGAGTDTLQAVDPVAAVDPEARLLLWHQVKAEEHRLTVLRRRPPAYPGAIRAAEVEYAALRRRYHALLEAPVRFTGTLRRRQTTADLLGPARLQP